MGVARWLGCARRSQLVLQCVQKTVGVHQQGWRARLGRVGPSHGAALRRVCAHSPCTCCCDDRTMSSEFTVVKVWGAGVGRGDGQWAVAGWWGGGVPRPRQSMTQWRLGGVAGSGGGAGASLPHPNICMSVPPAAALPRLPSPGRLHCHEGGGGPWGTARAVSGRGAARTRRRSADAHRPSPLALRRAATAPCCASRCARRSAATPARPTLRRSQSTRRREWLPPAVPPRVLLALARCPLTEAHAAPLAHARSAVRGLSNYMFFEAQRMAKEEIEKGNDRFDG